MSDKSVVRKYSKSSGFYQGTKKDFFAENGKLLEDALGKNRLYASQPARGACKICQTALPGQPDFISHEVGYVFCPQCSHLNGCFDDTITFVERLYVSDDSGYSKNYIDQNYDRRTADIYIPKIDFLLGSVPGQDVSILDVGCGSGYFVFAALQRGVAATGVDVGKPMIEFGNYQISQRTGQSPLTHTAEDDLFDYIETSKDSIISAIGVIEHLREPHKLFRAFQKSKASYLYYSVPMFSFSAVLENVFPGVFPRQLSGGHTHLFTEASISKMHEILGARAVAEWRFGTDVMDLYRSILVSLRDKTVSETLIQNFSEEFAPRIDALQSVLDSGHFCSEIHVLVQKN